MRYEQRYPNDRHLTARFRRSTIRNVKTITIERTTPKQQRAGSLGNISKSFAAKLIRKLDAQESR